jgi:hypothetical protein
MYNFGTVRLKKGGGVPKKTENPEVHEPSQAKSNCPMAHIARKPQSASPLRGLGAGAIEQAKCSSSKKCLVG